MEGRRAYIVTFAATLLLLVFSTLHYVNLSKPDRASKKENVSAQVIASRFESFSEGGGILSLDLKNRKEIAAHNADVSYPIASITKLMTAYVVLTSSLGNDAVTISPQAYAERGETPGIIPGATFYAGELIYPLLIGSSNDAAYALAEHIGISEFTERMNRAARDIGLLNTKFINPTGLDDVELNRSTPRDIAKFIEYLSVHKPEILAMTAFPEFTYSDTAGRSYTIQSTNILLSHRELRSMIVGGKTGETPRAKQSLALFANTKNVPYIHVVLYSDDRFGDMIKLISNTLE